MPTANLRPFSLGRPGREEAVRKLGAAVSSCSDAVRGACGAFSPYPMTARGSRRARERTGLGNLRRRLQRCTAIAHRFIRASSQAVFMFDRSVKGEEAFMSGSRSFQRCTATLDHDRRDQGRRAGGNEPEMAVNGIKRVGLIAAMLGVLLPDMSAAQEGGLTLSEVYGIVRQQNPRLHAAAALVDARRSMEASAGLPPDPALEVGVMNFSLPGLSANMPTSMAPSIQGMQMLPIGKLGLSGKIAEQSTAMAAADAEETWWEVRSFTAMAFYEVWQADRQIAVMRETLQWLQNFATVAKAMYTAGEGRQSDVLRAGVEVARMEADIKRMETMRTAAAAKLNAALNRPGNTPVPALTFEPVPLEIPAYDTLRGWAEQYRPMLDRGRTEVEQARTRLNLARREIWPDLTVGFQYGQRRAAADEMGAAGTERMGSLMVGFTVPVFARQRQLKMREEARAMEQMAAADLTNMRAQVAARIAEIEADLDRARTLVGLYRSQVLPQARATVESAFSSYRVGRVDFMTLVDAQMTKNQYEQELFSLLAEYGAATAELEMTIGRELPRGAAFLAEAT